MDSVLQRPAPPRMPETTAQQEASLRQLTLVIYALYALSLFTAMPVVIAVMLNYLRLAESRGTMYHSHLRWLLRSFWWGVFWTGVGSGVIVLGVLIAASSHGHPQAQTSLAVGVIMLIANWIWLLSRVVRGLVYWNEHRRMWT